MMKFKYSRHSGYEISSKGNKFSEDMALLADGRSILIHYQCDSLYGKGWDEGGKNWRAGKGKPSKIYKTREGLWNGYLTLWKIWAKANPHLMFELRCRVVEHGCTVRDSFATSEINQARALAQLLRDEDLETEPTEAY